MATSKVTETSALVEVVKPLLNVWEELRVEKDLSSLNYLITLRTNLYVHLKHTKKNTFITHSVYSAMSTTALPSKAFMEDWLKNARQTAHKLIQKGDYSDEKLIHGEWQTIKRKFNQYVYYNKELNMLVGKPTNLKH